jgi:glucoamylase
MLRGLIFHSDNLALSEQFDRDSGFERSLANLTWSYASFLSALRARAA